MQGFVRALELEIKERNALIELLEHADSFYETQKGEAKVVANVSIATVLCSASLRSFLRVILRVRSPKGPRSAATVDSRKDT